MRQVVSFDKLKLTNNELDDQGHVSHRALSSSPALPCFCSGADSPQAFSKRRLSKPCEVFFRKKHKCNFFLPVKFH